MQSSIALIRSNNAVIAWGFFGNGNEAERTKRQLVSCVEVSDVYAWAVLNVLLCNRRERSEQLRNAAWKMSVR